VNLLTPIVTNHLGTEIAAQAGTMISEFARKSKNAAIATDQLLNAVFLVTRPGLKLEDDERKIVIEALQKELAASPPPPV
jgi:hypothetical protein